MAILLLGNGINQNEKLVCSWDELLRTACNDDMKKQGKSAPKSILPSVDGLTMTLASISKSSMQSITILLKTEPS